MFEVMITIVVVMIGLKILYPKTLCYRCNRDGRLCNCQRQLGVILYFRNSCTLNAKVHVYDIVFERNRCIIIGQ